MIKRGEESERKLCNSPPVFHSTPCISFHLLYPKLGMMLGEILSCGDKMVASDFKLLLNLKIQM